MVRLPRLLILLILTIAAPMTASAIPVTYQIQFTVLSGIVTTVTFGNEGEPPTSTTTSAVGRTYFGLFAVDSDVLLTDGIGKYGALDYFFVQMEDNIWGYNHPSDNSFAGFRGQYADSSCPSGACLGAASPGFDVVNGEIVNLRGGVYGASDVPFVNFSPGFGSSQAENMFAAIGNAPLQVGGSRSYVGSIGPIDGSVVGTMQLIRMPEPSVLALFGIGLAGLGLARRARARNGQP